MDEPLRVLLFYQFFEVDDPVKLRDEQLALCADIGLLGRILVAHEGINGSVSGTIAQTNEYIARMRADARFALMDFKVEEGVAHPFTKLRVLVRDEIVAMKHEVDLENSAPYITSDELLKHYDTGEDAIILDARNDYEWKVGKFKNAMTLPIKTFREFPAKVMEALGDKKDAPIITYCTGGIRCEKASAFLREQGFTNVRQLKNGIISYCQTHPNTHWEGKCFVFDKRLMSAVRQKEDNVTKCASCAGACDLLRNCRNVACDAYVVLCTACETKLNGCCSGACHEEFLANCRAKSRALQGYKTKKEVFAQ